MNTKIIYIYISFSHDITKILDRKYEATIKAAERNSKCFGKGSLILHTQTKKYIFLLPMNYSQVTHGRFKGKNIFHLLPNDR